MREHCATAADQRTAPIRSYKEVVAIMRVRGDTTLTVQHIHYYEQSAFRKLRKLLAAEGEDWKRG